MSNEFLVTEYQRSLEGQTTPDCRDGRCQTCGVLETFPTDKGAMRQGRWGCVGVAEDAGQAGETTVSQP